MKKSKLLLFSLLALSVVLAAAFGAYRWHRNQQKYIVIRVAQCGPSLYKIPHYIAREKGLYRQQNIKIKELFFNSDREALAALSDGKADVAMVRPAGLIIKKASDLKEGPDLAAFASLGRGATYHLISAENKPLDNITSVRGKIIISGAPDSEETVFMEQLLRDKGLKPYEDLTLITNIPEDLRIGALKAGAGNYLLVEDSRLPDALTRELFRAASFQAGFPAFVCAARKDYDKERPGALQSFTNALYMAQIWAGYHSPGETATSLSKAGEIAGPSLPGLVENCYRNKNLAASPVLEKKEMESLIKILDRSREIPMPVKAEELINNDFANAAVGTVNYIPEDKQEKKGLRKLKFW
jgi:NitT/TauT family transport system substrate-binding protein